jgi:hypothetical protein
VWLSGTDGGAGTGIRSGDPGWACPVDRRVIAPVGELPT